MTVLEIEQALIVTPKDTEGKAKVPGKLVLYRLCGPLVEVVDEYAQFVHFTVQE